MRTYKYYDFITTFTIFNNSCGLTGSVHLEHRLNLQQSWFCLDLLTSLIIANDSNHHQRYKEGTSMTWDFIVFS